MKEKKYPRYFILADQKLINKYHSWKNILYCIVYEKKGKYFHVNKDGFISKGFGDNMNGELVCERCVEENIWKEIEAPEVALL